MIGQPMAGRFRIPVLIGVAILAALVMNALHLTELRLTAGIDTRPGIAAAFRGGALAIDPTDDWRIGPRRGFDCALLQATLPLPDDVPGFGLPGYADPRGLAEACEVLRDIAVGDPLAAHERDDDAAETGFGRGLIAAALAAMPISLLRWVIAACWLAAPLLGLVLGSGGWMGRSGAARAPGTDSGTVLFGPLLAVACVWLVGPSLSAALPVFLLLVLGGWASMSAGLRQGTASALLVAALFGAGLALAEYRAPMMAAGLATLAAIALRRLAIRPAAAVLSALALGAMAAILLHDLLAALWLGGDLGDLLLDRLDPASDPVALGTVASTFIDGLDALLPGPRSLAVAVLGALGFGLLFAPALLRASQGVPMSVGRAYAALAGVIVLVLWVAWFGGRSMLGAAEGGVLYAWSIAAALAATLHWLVTLGGVLAVSIFGNPARAGSAA